jgi:Uma2 family endonuclease
MLKQPIPPEQKLILENVSWEGYTHLLREFSHGHVRLTYDRGVLEIMTLSHEHENAGRFLGRLVVTLTEELSLPIKEGGSTTFRKKRKQKGLESDNCYWIKNEAAVRGKSVIRLRFDPPPDLAVEVDITRSSINRMRIYAQLRIPEVWRFNVDGLAFLVLNEKRKYEVVAVSPTFAISISPADLIPFMEMRVRMDENAVIREFRAWIRAKIAGAKPA